MYVKNLRKVVNTLFENIKKFIKDPTNLTKLFYGATAIVILERIFALCYTVFKTQPLKYSWHPFEYTLALLLPLAGFAYLCSSKYAKNTNNKIKAYVATYIVLAIYYFCILAQIANDFIWFILELIGLHGDNLQTALLTIPNFEEKLHLLVRTITLYLPFIYILIYIYI
jgi:hypothetical protein